MCWLVGIVQYQSSENINRQFHTIHEIPFRQQMPDGFQATYETEHREMVIMDSTRDVKLRALISMVNIFLSKFTSIRERILMLGKFIIQRLGIHTDNNHEKFKDVFRLAYAQQQPLGKDEWVKIEIGQLIPGAGLQRHSSILYKYLADRVDPPIVCRLVRRWISDVVRTDVQIQLSDGDYFVDLCNENTCCILSPDMFNQEIQRKLQLSQPSRPSQEALRILYQDFRWKVDHSATEFITVWKDTHKLVHTHEMMEQSYDISCFIRESNILATSFHSSIIRVRAICLLTTSTPMAVVRDLFESQPLSKVMHGDRRRWTFDVIMKVAVQLAEALHELHVDGIIIGDLNPSNILITPVGDARIGDFRMNRYRTNHSISWPVAYLAPEHLEKGPMTTVPVQSGTMTSDKKNVDLCIATAGSQKGDMYSFGCVLHALAVGTEVWHGMSDHEILNAILVDHRSPKVSPECDGQIADVIKKCVQYQPSDRPTFDDLATTLRAIKDVAKKMVPDTQVAPFGYADLVRL